MKSYFAYHSAKKISMTPRKYENEKEYEFNDNQIRKVSSHDGEFYITSVETLPKVSPYYLQV